MEELQAQSLVVLLCVRINKIRKKSYSNMTSAKTISSIFPADTGYQVEKVSGATGSNSDRAVAEAAISSLRPNIETFRSELNARGLEGDEMTIDALYIIDRAREFLKGSPTSPAGKDLYIMASVLKGLVKDMQKVANDIDQEDKKTAK